VRLAAQHIDLVGLGGIGSPTAFLLTKMGCRDIRAFDGDEVEDVNVCSTMYKPEDALRGSPKALACEAICREFSGAEIEAVPHYVRDQRLRGIVILGVDSMRARRDIWDVCVRDRPKVPWLIDARMGAESGAIYVAKPTLPADQRFYEASLYTDEQSLILPCTGRAILYNTFFIASLIGRQVKRLVMDQPVERRIDFDLDGLLLMVDR